MASMHSAFDSPEIKRWRWIVIMTLTIGYGCYYACRSNVSVISPSLLDDDVFDGESLGLMLSLGTFAYAVAKLCLGPIIDNLGGKWIFLLGGVISAAANLVMGIWGDNGYVFAAGWTVSRFVQAWGWACIVYITPRWVSPKAQGRAFAILSSGFLFGDAIWRVVLGAMLKVMTWKTLVIVTALFLFVAMFVCLFLIVESPVKLGGEEPRDDLLLPDEEQSKAVEVGMTPEQQLVHKLSVSSNADYAIIEQKQKKSYMYLVKPLLVDPRFWCVFFLAIADTFVRETFRDWTSVYFKGRVHLTPSDAAEASVVFPLAGGISALLAGVIVDRITRRQRGLFLFVLSSLQCVALGALWFFSIGDDDVNVLLAIFLVFLVGLVLTAPFSFIAGVLAVEISGKERAATCSTIFESVGYLVSGVSGILTGKLVKSGGGAAWSYVFMLMEALSVMATVAIAGYWFFSLRYLDSKEKLQPMEAPLLGPGAIDSSSQDEEKRI